MSTGQNGRGISLKQLAEPAGAELVGDGGVLIDRVATLDGATSGAIAFLANPRYRHQLKSTRASAIIIEPRFAALFHPASPVAPGIHPTAVVATSARVAASATIGPLVVVGERASIGERTRIHAGCVIGEDCSVGDDVVFFPRVVLYARTVIGARTLVHSGAVLGADGFGMAEENGKWIKVPQFGRVVVGSDVEIGANTTIDRGAIDDTVIEDDVKLDNQIQVGHNCRIGAHTAIAGCVGIAGSVRIGRDCRIGGAAMITGHLEIADGTVISASSGVYSSIQEPGVYTGAFPALPHREWQHVASVVRRLRSFADRIRALERERRGQGE
jgi:UDP-3-O-[3-hydroxymyristoyl] glucosamine N-acyltransferase